MKTFAFIPTQSLQKTYASLLITYKRKDSMLDLIKISVLACGFFVCLFIYLYYVSLSSTRGYFLRKENQRLSNTSFQYEILKTQLLDIKQKNRGNLGTSPATKKDVQIITIPAEDLIQTSQTIEKNIEE